MKNFLRNVSFVFVSLVLIFFIFLSGLFVGQGRLFNDFQKGNVLNSISTSVSDADFEPFWRVWSLLETKYIPASSTMQISDQEKVWGAISGLVDSMEDPYTQFLPPKENEAFEISISGEFSGVGMEIGVEDGILTVVAPLKDTPAQRAGIKSGDKIIAIDGEITQKINVDEAVSMIRGEIGTEVVLTIFRDGIDEPFEISVIRDNINIPTSNTRHIGDMFVISLYNFSANSASDFRAALREFALSKKSKLLLDLRGNPGGFLDAAVDMASWFLPAGKIIVSEDFGNGEQKHFRSKGYNIFGDNLEMVILVDRGSASASEILAGALNEHGVATLVGEDTFGKGSVQELIPVTSNTSIKVTIARWLTPEGKSISDGGLSPDILIDKVPEDLDIDLFDYQFNEALRYLSGK